MPHCVNRRNVLFSVAVGTRVFVMAVALYSLGFLCGVTAVSSAAEQKRLDDSPRFGFRQGKEAGYIDRTGKIVIQPQFRKVTRFSEQLAAVANASYRWGYVDTEGKVVIKPQFAEANGFHEGFACVRIRKTQPWYGKGDTWGYIDKAGKMVIQPIFNETTDFRDGAAWAHTGGKLVEHAYHQPPSWEGGKWHRIDTAGKSFWSTPDDSE